jgi:hypothetical protein
MKVFYQLALERSGIGMKTLARHWRELSACGAAARARIFPS